MSENKETVPTSESESAGVAESSDATDELAHDSDHHEVGFEPESLQSMLILGIVFATSVVVVVLILIGFTITTSYAQKNMEKMVSEAEYPEIRDVQAAAIAEMNKSGVVDAEAGIYRISVDEAMDLMVEMQYKNPEGEFTNELQIKPPQ